MKKVILLAAVAMLFVATAAAQGKVTANSSAKAETAVQCQKKQDCPQAKQKCCKADAKACNKAEAKSCAKQCNHDKACAKNNNGKECCKKGDKAGCNKAKTDSKANADAKAHCNKHNSEKIAK